MPEWENFVLHVLIQLAVIIAAARAGAWLLGKIGQPQVVGEIVAGLILGPSLLGRFAPEAVEFIFPADATVVFRVLSELGLVLLVFLIGLEFDFSHLRQVGRTAVGVAGAGIVFPFALGIALALWMHPQVAADVNRIGFVLIVAVALSMGRRSSSVASRGKRRPLKSERRDKRPSARPAHGFDAVPL